MITACNPSKNIFRDVSNDETKQYIDDNNNIVKKSTDYTDSDIVCIEAPYAFKLFLQEVESMGISTRLIANCVLEEWQKINNKLLPTFNLVKEAENRNMDGAYYITKGADNTKPMRRFHNQIKLNLMSGAARKNGSIVDFSCGRGGDLYKWYKARYTKVLGIDLSKENIESTDPEISGANSRLNNMKDDSNTNMKLWANNSTIDFITGDSSKNIYDLSLADDKYKPILDARLKQYGKNFADCVSMLFSIHYLFNDLNNISMLLKNVSKVLDKNGVFIVATLDGPSVFNALKKSANNIISGNVYDHKTEEYVEVWKIRADPDLDLTAPNLPNTIKDGFNNI